MIGFLGRTWFAWWVFASLIILRWFHVVRSSETIEQELVRNETVQKSAAAA